MAYLLLAAAFVVLVMRYPHLAEAVLAAAFLLWLCWCFKGDTTRRATMGAAYRGRSACSLGGPCGPCGMYVADIAAHEAGHVAAAEKLGYKVSGAIVYGFGDGGFTRVPGWGTNAWDTMRMAAAGAAGENRNRMVFKAGLNGGKSEQWTDAWWVHRLAPQVAKQRGITTAEAIAAAQREADRLVAANSGRWREAQNTLARNRQFGDIS